MRTGQKDRVCDRAFVGFHCYLLRESNSRHCRACGYVEKSVDISQEAIRVFRGAVDTGSHIKKRREDNF